MTHFLTRTYADIVDDPQLFDAALRTPLPQTFRIHSAKGDAAQVLASLAAQGIRCTPLPWLAGAFRVTHMDTDASEHAALLSTFGRTSLGRTLPFLAGAIYVQEEVAMTAVAALAPSPGQLVFDMCAAPGGKTAQIAEAVGPQGRVFAAELMNARIASLGATTSRLALTNVAGLLGDARHAPFPYGSLDAALCDVPCSGEGTARKVQGEWTEYDTGFLARLPAIQSQLLRRALHLTRPGGYVVYSTCTFRSEENEAVLSNTLGDLGEVVPFSLPGFEGSPALENHRGITFREDVRHARRFWPHTHDTGGFFVALIRRSDTPTFRKPTPVRPRASNWKHGGVRAEHLRKMLEWFGLEDTCLNGLRPWTRGNDKVWLANEKLAPIEGMTPDFMGYVAFKASDFRLWPTGFFLQALGMRVTKHFVDLDFASAFRYAAGDDVEVPLARRTEAGNGPVQVRSGGLVLGKGVLHEGRLTSQVSKGLRFAKFA